MSDFGELTHHKGRKDHRCIWCGQTIPKGESFAHYKGIWEGNWQNWRMHEECYASCDSLDYEDGFEPYAHKRGSTEER